MKESIEMVISRMQLMMEGYKNAYWTCGFCK
jgi:hypothetical protein